MISIGENKSILCKGDFHPAQLYKGDKKIAGYKLTEFEGTGSVMLENCYNDKVYDAEISENALSITVRGKNYFDLNKVPFNESTTIPYNNGLTAKKIEGANRGKKIPISLPAGKTIHMTLDVVDSQINGTSERVGMGFYNSGGTSVYSVYVSSGVAHKSYSFTLNEEIFHIQFVFLADNERNAVGDYVTMDNIMFRTEGDDSFELYIEPQTIPFENGGITADIPTFKGTTVLETGSAEICAKYKKKEG